MKKDTRKWCYFHKIPWHNTDEFDSKQTLVDELKETGSSPNSDFDSNNNKRRQIIDAEPTIIFVTAIIQPKELEHIEEGGCLFHSHMWVNGTPLHFIVDRRIHKNLISAEVIKQLNFLITPHLHPYNIGWLHQG
jgi:hypothetical protein